MGNINPASTSPSSAPLRSASKVTSQMQNEDTVRNYLKKEFGDDVGEEAFKLLQAEAKTGKQLSFDVVKGVILKAAEKFHKSADLEKIRRLSYLFQEPGSSKPAPQEPGKDPFAHLAFQLKSKVETDKRIEQSKEASAEYDVDREVAKKAEIAEREAKKKLRDPSKRV